ncbi:hypothetical protein [Nitrosomonas sp. Nm58]|uniref:hypothetical protein n=1 Tax=Nitrosomonas sp. Nm58 TaxID=200126 RepID=UPI000897A99C|nr:hypothetical protein [Nitrosomonas sp. Nm58]SDY26553.1 hypothetical protein SAMN05421754_100520 [Nitrosomonas sp. Nm58]
MKRTRYLLEFLRPTRLQLALLPLVISVASPSFSGIFEFAGEEYGVDVITHPPGYRGTGTILTVTVGISPLSSHAQEMVIPIQNIINTWNNLIPTVDNIVNEGSNDSLFQFDFESVALHELGHCIGLGHPNLASESGLNGSDRNFTHSTRGADNQFNLDSGADGVIGSGDDLRGDDMNLHWFRKSNNNPFSIATKVDVTTYSRDQSDLPPRNTFAANAARNVGALFDIPNTEAVMQQGVFAGETQRTLAADDVATARLAMSGLDRLAGTADDYSLKLEFAGFTDNADIVFGFDDNRASFSVCEISAEPINPSHFVITRGRIYFSSNISWFFNNTSSPFPPQRSLPAPTIFANQITDSLTLTQNDTVTLTVSLNPGVYVGNQVDYWVRAITPMGTFWLNDRLGFIQSDQPIRAHGGELIAINHFPILNTSASALPAGTYTVTFAVDDNLDGIVNGTFNNTVTITLTP